MSDQTLRREFLLATALSATLAGCSSGDPDTTTTTRPTRTTGSETTTTTTTTSQPGVRGHDNRPPRPDYDGWFSKPVNTVTKYGQSTVTVSVGEPNDEYTFDPKAVQVTPGTTVVWKWTGGGGRHDVTAVDGSFQSELVGEKGHTFRHTFTEPGIHRYVCRPHRALGQIGAVVVGRDYPTVLPDAPLRWYVDTYHRYYHPVRGGDQLYALSDGTLYAFDAATGGKRWQFTAQHIEFEPVVSDGTVYVATPDSLYALDANTGSRRWSHSVESEFMSAPVVHDDTIYAASARAVFAFDADGNRKWRHQVEYLPESLTATDNAVYAGGGQADTPAPAVLLKLSPETGEILWEFTSDSVRDFFVSTVQDAIVHVIGELSGLARYYAVDTTNGRVLWSVNIGNLDMLPRVQDGTVYLGGDSRTLRAFDAKTGDVAWRFQTDDPIESTPVVTADRVYVQDASTVYTLDAASGNVRNRHGTTGSIYRTDATDSPLAYVGDWGVWAFDAAPSNTGGGESVELPVTVRGTTFVGDWDRGLFVLTQSD